MTSLDFKKTGPNINLNKLPDDLTISTMTVTCSFDTLFNVQNINNYMELKFGGILYIKYGDVNNIRSLIKVKKKNKKTKKKSKSFYNQATVITDTENKKRINTKLFKNGSIQMTGCKSLEHCIESLKLLCIELKKVKAVYNKKERKIVRKPFISNPENMCLDRVNNFKIRMINSNFDVGFLVNRQILFDILNKKSIICTYEPCIHACVNVKYNYNNKDTISIFVFESGSIIITGAKTQDHIAQGYKFITNILFENYGDIVKSDIDEFLNRIDIAKFIQDNILVEVA